MSFALFCSVFIHKKNMPIPHYIICLLKISLVEKWNINSYQCKEGKYVNQYTLNFNYLENNTNNGCFLFPQVWCHSSLSMGHLLQS